ncbi:hypothetical protein [Novipirellula artificiosorum]|uniref:AAA+ ATPase domain-containing protein n=1 Tax=Novipirellula artificiosorum TaxID=2528016 RepID=A0A5C6DVP8_9BACT|nr:hypothetical protein [Novipirellula artificiosorum]TWU40708.1 hypothetical protein Poly41_15430 [Novipirellula artificiosorum]
MDQFNAFAETRCGYPWAWCNLFRNPFGELTPAERASLAVVEIEPIVRAVNRQRVAVQLLGDCGRGKTTRLLAILKFLPNSSYVYLDEDLPCGAIPEGNPLLIDEAQRLPRSVARIVFATGLPLVLATHRDLSRRLRTFGYQVMTYRLGDDNDAQLVYEVMNRRIEASRLGPGTVPTFTLQDAAKLVAIFGSNLRSIEAFLYDQVQKQVHSNGEMRFID